MLIKQDENQAYAIDGKALKGTAIKGEANSFIHTVSLWACDQQLTLGQVKVKDKSNEITAIPKLLEMIDIHGATITLDAMGTQTAIAAQIIERGGDYVLALKGNQSSLHDEVSNYFIQAQQVEFEAIDHQSYHMVEKGHERLEKRSFFVTEDIDWLPNPVRKIALVLLKQDKQTKGGIELKRKKADSNPDYLLQLMNVKF